MKQFSFRPVVKNLAAFCVALLIFTVFAGFKKPYVNSSPHWRNGYPTIYMVYATGPQNLPGSYNTPYYEVECEGYLRLCAIYVEDLDLDGVISSAELLHFVNDYDTNANGLLSDEAYIPGVLIKKGTN